MLGNSVVALQRDKSQAKRGPPVCDTETHDSKHTYGTNTADDITGLTYCELHHDTDAIQLRQSSTLTQTQTYPLRVL